MKEAMLGERERLGLPPHQSTNTAERRQSSKRRQTPKDTPKRTRQIQIFNEYFKSGLGREEGG